MTGTAFLDPMQQDFDFVFPKTQYGGHPQIAQYKYVKIGHYPDRRFASVFDDMEPQYQVWTFDAPRRSIIHSIDLGRIVSAKGKAYTTDAFFEVELLSRKSNFLAISNSLNPTNNHGHLIVHRPVPLFPDEPFTIFLWRKADSSNDILAGDAYVGVPMIWLSTY